MDWKDKIVVITGADRAVGRALTAALTAEGASVQALHSAPPALGEELQWAGAVNGRIDALFCDATVSDPGMSALQLTPDVIRRYTDDSACFAWKSALYAVPRLKAAGSGAVVFITNAAARHPQVRNAVSAVCSTAVEAITRNFASEVASSGIRICAVLQGAGASPEETADAAVFLAGTDASYMTGTTIEVNGEGGLAL